jgi:hypothetical protein
MGRRSRKRSATPARDRAAAAAPPVREGARPVDRAPARPPASAPPTPRHAAPTPPWGAFPLVELCALAAIVVGVWGLLRGGRGGAVMLTVAAMLGSVAGLEVAIREHLGGYRSHTLVLSGACAIGTVALLFFAGVQRPALLPVAAVVFAAAALGLWTVFKRRSGGVGVRVR